MECINFDSMLGLQKHIGFHGGSLGMKDQLIRALIIAYRVDTF